MYYRYRFLFLDASNSTIDPLLTDPHGTGPGSDNLKGWLKRAHILKYVTYVKNKYINIEFPK
jgi:hypothetical protein